VVQTEYANEGRLDEQILVEVSSKQFTGDHALLVHPLVDQTR
jgi:hypothetical protein